MGCSNSQALIHPSPYQIRSSIPPPSPPSKDVPPPAEVLPQSSHVVTPKDIPTQLDAPIRLFPSPPPPPPPRLTITIPSSRSTTLMMIPMVPRKYEAKIEPLQYHQSFDDVSTSVTPSAAGCSLILPSDREHSSAAQVSCTVEHVIMEAIEKAWVDLNVKSGGTEITRDSFCTLLNNVELDTNFSLFHPSCNGQPWSPISLGETPLGERGQVSPKELGQVSPKELGQSPLQLYSPHVSSRHLFVPVDHSLYLYNVFVDHLMDQMKFPPNTLMTYQHWRELHSILVNNQDQWLKFTWTGMVRANLIIEQSRLFRKRDSQDTITQGVMEHISAAIRRYRTRRGEENNGTLSFGEWSQFLHQEATWIWRAFLLLYHRLLALTLTQIRWHTEFSLYILPLQCFPF